MFRNSLRMGQRLTRRRTVIQPGGQRARAMCLDSSLRFAAFGMTDPGVVQGSPDWGGGESPTRSSSVGGVGGRLVRRWAPPNHTNSIARCQDDYDGQHRSPPAGIIEVEMHRASEGRQGRGRGGGPMRPDGVLLRGCRRRRVEDDGWGHLLGARQRRVLQHGGGGRGRGERLGPERGLRGDGRGLHPRQRDARRRRLQVD